MSDELDRPGGPYPTWDARNDSCERATAELRIYGDHLDPARITNVLGLSPTQSQAKGESSTNSIGRTRTAGVGGWFLSSEGTVESNDIRRHLDWLLAILVPRSEALKVVQRTTGTRSYINCVWWSKYGNGGPTLTVDQMRLMSSLDLECRFDVAFFGEDDET